jgi:hypothetical protein
MFPREADKKKIVDFVQYASNTNGLTETQTPRILKLPI